MVDEKKVIPEKIEGSQELSPEDIDKLYSVLALCTETYSTLTDFGKKLKQIIAFHEDEIKKGNDFFSGKKRLEVSGNIKNVNEGLTQASEQIKQILQVARQMLPLAKVAYPTLGGGSKGAKEGGEKENKDSDSDDE
jgi:hypothetical protein